MSPIPDDDLRWLLELLQREGLAEVEVHEGDTEVVVRGPEPLAPPPAAATVPAESGTVEPWEQHLAENHIPVLSPMAGVFYRASSPELPPYAKEGDEVEHGDALCLVEAMKLFNDVPAPASGKIIRVLVENGEQVEADQPLMIIEH